MIMSTTIRLSFDSLFRAMRDAGDNISVYEAVSEMETLVRHAKLNPSEFRSARAQFRHHKDMGIKTKHYQELIGYMTKLESKYGNRSLIFQTMIEAVSCVKLSSKQIQSLYRKSGLPPAYDPSKRSPLSDPIELSDDPRISLKGSSIRADFFAWIDTTDDPIISHLKRMLTKPMVKRDGTRKADKYALLRNGSTSGITYHNRRWLDIEAQCFVFPEFNYEYPAISRYFGIINHVEGLDNFVYLEIPNEWKGMGGIHTVVSDKDGKMREVYFLLAAFQSICKGIVDRLDPKMRECWGIYTYRQKDWLESILEFGFNKTKLLITVDMEKFSDTILRKYLLELLNHLGIPEPVITELEELLSVPIFDRVLDEPLGTHEVVLQGQYSVFLFMSVLNICLQRYINDIYNNRRSNKIRDDHTRFYSAALGDDTGMIFDRGEFSIIFRRIQEVYGSFGMRINELKSDHIDKGVGQGDFAKVHFDSAGIIDHINPKNIQNNNVDEFIKDILNLSKPTQYKIALLDSLFGTGSAKRIISLSSINGGLSDHAILEEDINYYINNLTRINFIINKENRPDEYGDLITLSRLYKEAGSSILSSPLVLFIPEEQRILIETLSEEEAVDLLITSVLNANTVGADIDFEILKKAIGLQPSILKKAFTDEQHSQDKTILSEIYLEFKKFDSFIAKRKLESTGRKSSIYLPSITGTCEVMYSKHPIISHLQKITDIKSLDEYEQIAESYKRSRIQLILQAHDIYFEDRMCWGKECSWINIRTDEYGWLKFRLHSVSSDYQATAPFFSKNIFDMLMVPILIKHASDIDYMSFLNWCRSGIIG